MENEKIDQEEYIKLVPRTISGNLSDLSDRDWKIIERVFGNGQSLSHVYIKRDAIFCQEIKYKNERRGC